MKNADGILELCGFCECLWGMLEERVLVDAVTFIAEVASIDAYFFQRRVAGGVKCHSFISSFSLEVQGVGRFEGSHKALLKEELIMI